MNTLYETKSYKVVAPSQEVLVESKLTEKQAEAILCRFKEGPVGQIKELLKIKGIGPKAIEKIQHLQECEVKYWWGKEDKGVKTRVSGFYCSVEQAISIEMLHKSPRNLTARASSSFLGARTFWRSGLGSTYFEEVGGNYGIKGSYEILCAVSSEGEPVNSEVIGAAIEHKLKEKFQKPKNSRKKGGRKKTHKRDNKRLDTASMCNMFGASELLRRSGQIWKPKAEMVYSEENILAESLGLVEPQSEYLFGFKATGADLWHYDHELTRSLARLEWGTGWSFVSKDEESDNDALGLRWGKETTSDISDENKIKDMMVAYDKADGQDFDRERWFSDLGVALELVEKSEPQLLLLQEMVEDLKQTFESKRSSTLYWVPGKRRLSDARKQRKFLESLIEEFRGKNASLIWAMEIYNRSLKGNDERLESVRKSLRQTQDEVEHFSAQVLSEESLYESSGLDAYKHLAYLNLHSAADDECKVNRKVFNEQFLPGMHQAVEYNSKRIVIKDLEEALRLGRPETTALVRTVIPAVWSESTHEMVPNDRTNIRYTKENGVTEVKPAYTRKMVPKWSTPQLLQKEKVVYTLVDLPEIKPMSEREKREVLAMRRFSMELMPTTPHSSKKSSPVSSAEEDFEDLLEVATAVEKKKKAEPGDVVVHPVFGEGEVRFRKGNKLSIRFKDYWGDDKVILHSYVKVA